MIISVKKGDLIFFLMLWLVGFIQSKTFDVQSTITLGMVHSFDNGKT